MDKLGFIGGMTGYDTARRILGANRAGLGPGDGWRVAHEDAVLFLESRGGRPTTFEVGSVKVLLWGHARPKSQAAGPPDAAVVAAQVAQHYSRTGDLPINLLEGSYATVVMDVDAGRVLLYRNLFGSGFLYFTRLGRDLLFASNLAELVRALDSAPEPNRDMLPVFFLYRWIPGRETLFKGVHRLMAGELITYDGERLSRSQRQTFAEFGESPKVGRDAVDRIEATMSEVIADCRAVCPGASNLLSGGVDSSYLQARWNKSRSCDGRPLRSFAIVVDHARTRLDEEYSLSSARALGVELVRVPADGRYSDYLVETLSGTGEPPNHVQAVYFGHLARTMAGLGVGAGICGEGADSLFGVGTADAIRLATAFRKFIPVGALRRFGASLAAGIRSDSLSEVLRSADWIDDESNSDHPLNRMASFSDWDSVSACFGGEAVAAATAYRRGLLDQFRVPDDPLQRLHAIGFLGEAVDSASFWKTLFNHGGIDLLCPFLDSRIVQLAMNIRPEYRFQFRRPKELLKKALSHHVPAEIAYRRKLGFGQPIFEWMSPGGQLRPLIERIGRYDFVPDDVMARACRQPNWFLYSLLCYDLWHKIFIEKSLPVLTSGPGDSRRLCHS